MKPQLEPLETRLVPTVLTNHGGPVVAYPNVFDVFLQSSQPTMDQVAKVLVGPYAQMLAPYGIHAGTFGGSATLSLSQSVVYDADIHNVLTRNILAGTLPQPGPNEVYMIYLASDQTFGDSWLQGLSGYHSSFLLNGRWVYYSVVRYQSAESVPASHEFAETVTDPIVGTGWFGADTSQEEADLENWRSFNLDGFNVTLVTLPNGQVLPNGQASPGGQSLPSSSPPAPSTPVKITADAQDLSAVWIERIFADLWGFLARLNPAVFAAKAQQSQATLTANPALATVSGQDNVNLADQFFAVWIRQQSF